MFKLRFCLLFLIALLSLGGCSLEKAKLTHPSETGIHGTIIIDCWKLFEGSVEMGNVGELVSIDEPKIENDPLDLYDAKYTVYDVSADKLEFRTVSGWRILLPELPARNIAPSGKIILAAPCQEPPVICIYDPDSEETQLLFREDIAKAGIAAYELDDFDLYVDGEELQKTAQIEAIWKIHTDHEEHEKAWPVLDGDWDFYSLRLVHKEHPALQYEINFGICDQVLYIENLTAQEEVCVPVDEIR